MTARGNDSTENVRGRGQHRDEVPFRRRLVSLSRISAAGVVLGFSSQAVSGAFSKVRTILCCWLNWRAQVDVLVDIVRALRFGRIAAG